MANSPIKLIADTNIISNRGDVQGNAHLLAWLERHAEFVHVSVVTVAEMRRGLRACSTISASFCCVEQALSLCFRRQLWRRAEALICRRCLILLEKKFDALTDQRVLARERRRLDWKWEWYNEVTGLFANRIEPIDKEVAEKWADISVQFPALRDADKAIAATALAKGFGVATENIGHFRRMGLVLVNPFDPNTWDNDVGDDPIAALLGPQ